ncbi:hypothetical protein ACROYT_G035072, partial [Oculina patagonica]
WCSLPKIPWHDEADYFARPWRFCIQHLVTYRVSEAARFDTVENKWEKIADIQEARYNAFGVAANKKIFIAGGVGNLKRTALKTCEVYNMLTDEWQFMACLTGAHHLRPRRQQGNLFLVNETLYVLGEFWLGDCIVTVECYDDEKQKWNAKTCIQIHKSILAYKASSLNIFKGSLNNLKAVVSDIGLQNMYLAEFNYKYEPQ